MAVSWWHILGNIFAGCILFYLRSHGAEIPLETLGLMKKVLLDFALPFAAIITVWMFTVSERLGGKGKSVLVTSVVLSVILGGQFYSTLTDLIEKQA